MSLIFSDSFTEAVDTDLHLHVPNIGTGWSLLWQTGSTSKATVIAATGRARTNATVANSGYIYTADASYTVADYEISVLVPAGFTGSNRGYLILRCADINNMYALRFSTGGANTRLYKKVGGTWTGLGSFITDPAVGDVLKFEINGTTLKYYYNGVLKDTQTDSALSGIGKAGYGAGGGANLAASTDDLLNTSALDNFTVTDTTSSGTSVTVNASVQSVVASVQSAVVTAARNVSVAAAVLGVAANLLAPTITAQATTLMWKGYTWNLRNGGTGGPGFGGWSNSNAYIDSNGYLRLQMTNPSGSAPIGAQLTNQTAGLGYGTYTVVTEKDFTTLDKNIVFGGVFPFYYGNPYIEFDIAEFSKWDTGYPNTQIGHAAWYGTDPENPSIQEQKMDVPSDLIQTHQFIWSPGNVVFRSYIGATATGTPYFETTFNTNIPAPSTEQVLINMWAFAIGTPDSGDTDIPATEVIVRDFTFSAGTPVSINAAVQSASFSIQSPSVTTVKNVSVNPVTQSSVISVISPTVSAVSNTTQSTAVQTAVFSVSSPSVTAIRSASVTPNAQSAVLTLPTITVSGTQNAAVTPSVQTATISVVSSVVGESVSVTVNANTASALFSVPTPVVSAVKNVSISPNSAAVIIGIQAPTVSATQNLAVTTSVQSFTASLQSPTVQTSRNAIINAGTQQVAFSIEIGSVAAVKNISFAASTLAATYTVGAPSIITTKTAHIAPDTGTLFISTPAPVISAEIYATINASTLSVNFSFIVPSVAAIRNATPYPYHDKASPYSKKPKPYASKINPYKRLK